MYVVSLVFTIIFLFTSCSSYNVQTRDNQFRAEILDRNGKILALKSIEYSDISFKRHYPYKQVAAHVIGYALKKQTSYTGKKGVEKEYNNLLSQNKNVQLTIDIRLQKYISGLFQGKSGVAIVMGIDGEILSVGSYPEYDLNIFIDGMKRSEYQKLANYPQKPFSNKFIHALYRPGSLIKPVINMYYPSEKKALEHGINDIAKTLKRYGFGVQTGIDLPNEFHGLVPSKKWKMEKYQEPWYIGETKAVLKGEGSLLVTPIQIANYTVLLATGQLPQPYVKKGIQKSKDILNKNEFVRLKTIQNTLSKTVVDKKLKLATFYAELNERNHIYSWTTSYAPVDNPKYIVTILLENKYNSERELKSIILKIYNKLGELNYVH